MPNKGIVVVFPLVIVAALVVFFVLVIQKPLTNLTKKETQIELQTQYQNPFDKDSQYVNPFSVYKNPFDQL